MEMGDLVSDCPKLPYYTFDLVMKPMFESKKLSLKDIKWLEQEDEEYY
jgi:hypothetical protein